MKIFSKPIFYGFAPNQTEADLILALKFLLLPWYWSKWQSGVWGNKVQDWFKNFFNLKHAFVFDSGRSSLFFSLKALGVGIDDEVLVQGYTCMVVVNAIKQIGATPIYVDIGDDLNINPLELENKITTKTKVLIIQHTFGQPAKIEQILVITKKHNLKIIEDCSHSLGSTHDGRLVGTFGDISFFSFGSEKMVSCVRGGALITNDDRLAESIASLQSSQPLCSKFKIFQHLANYPFFAFSKPLYNVFLGKLVLKLAKITHLTTWVVYPEEKRGEGVHFFPSQFPNALAEIIFDQLQKIDSNLAHRREVFFWYDKYLDKKIDRPYVDWQESGCLSFQIFVDDFKKISINAKKRGVYLSDAWTGQIIIPTGIDWNKTNYKEGDCPVAEQVSKKIFCLPTHRRIKEVQVIKIAKCVNENFMVN